MHVWEPKRQKLFAQEKAVLKIKSCLGNFIVIDYNQWKIIYGVFVSDFEKNDFKT